MAPKVNQLRTLYKIAHRLGNPNPNFLVKRSIFVPSQTQILLHSRCYSDVPQQLQIDPPAHEKPQSNGHAKNNQNVNLVSNLSPSLSSLNEVELAKFSAIAETWWDAEGPFKPLHAMNPTRLAFIRSTLCRHFKKDIYCARPFEGLKFVDVGCGGGILSEPLARMGATVTGIDAVEKNVKIARLHAVNTEKVPRGQNERALKGFGSNNFINRISLHNSWLVAVHNYIMWTEKLIEEQREFDAVIALEVVEHVANPAEFCKSLASLTVSNGATVISTINRSMRAYATAIIIAENLLRWLPKGTHQWSSLITPEELALVLQRDFISVQEMAGIVYNPLTGRWTLSDDISVNFIAFGTKNSQ